MVGNIELRLTTRTLRKEKMDQIEHQCRYKYQREILTASSGPGMCTATGHHCWQQQTKEALGNQKYLR